MSTPSKPATLRAHLISAGMVRPTATVHHYYQTRRVEIPGFGACWEHVFRCFKTGAERRWGLDYIEGDASTDDGGN